MGGQPRDDDAAQTFMLWSSSARPDTAGGADPELLLLEAPD
jgi:hypothetical protein